jgi:hypothetical protein
LLFRGINADQPGELAYREDLKQGSVDSTQRESAFRTLDLLLERDELAHECSAHPLDLSEIEQYFFAAGSIHQTQELFTCFLDGLLVKDAALGEATDCHVSERLDF